MDPRTGEVLDGRYRLLRRIGEGGRGVVYEALHLEMERRVAVKLLVADTTRDASALERFRREGKAGGRLAHPGIVTVHDFRVGPGGEPYLVMELCEGGSLEDEMGRSGRLTLARSAQVVEEVAAAMDAAHGAGIVHRDLKPANVLFAGDRAKVADFGMAALVEGDAAGSRLTGEMAVGTPYYMSPEQAEARPVDARSDVYALAVLAYEMVTGAIPFDGPSVHSVLLKHLTARPAPPHEVDPTVPAAVSEAILAGLEKLPERRPASAGAFARAFVSAARLSPPSGAVSTRPVVVVPPVDEPPPGLPGTDAEPVGREAELFRMSARFADALRGKGGVVLVAGEAGTGKTTLVEAFVGRETRNRPEVLPVLARCSEQFGAGEAYAPFLEMAARLGAGPERSRVSAFLRDVAPTWWHHLPVAGRQTRVTGRDDGGALPAVERMPREMADFIGVLAAVRPLLLVLEDLHWADRSSVELVAGLGRGLQERRVLLVVTYRPSEMERARTPLKQALRGLASTTSGAEVVPGPLGEAEIAAVMERELGGPPAGALSRFVAERTDGNPLFVVLFVRHLRDTGAVARDGARFRALRPLVELAGTVPAGVADVIQAQLERLDDDDRRLLQLASVQGTAFDAAALSAVLPADELLVEDRLERLHRQHRLVQPAGELELPDGSASAAYRLSHAFYQNALYAGVPPKRRATWHAGLAKVLEARHAGAPDEVAGVLAFHHERGRDAARAIEWLARAAEAAALRNPKEAPPLWSRAVALAGRLGAGEAGRSKARLLVRLGRIQWESAELVGDPGLYGLAAEAVREAMRLDPEGPHAADARTTLGLVHLERGENEEALAVLSAAARRWPSHAPAHAALAYLFKNTGLWDESQRAQEEAGRLDPRHRHSIPRLSTLIYQGRHPEALVEAEALLHERPGYGHYAYWKGIAHFYAGEREAAREWIERGYALDPDNRIAQGVLAFVRAVDGRVAEARDLLGRAERGAAADGTFTYWLAKVASALGDTAAALVFIERAEGLGYWNAPWILRDPALLGVRDAEGFAPLLARIEERRLSFAGRVQAIRGA